MGDAGGEVAAVVETVFCCVMLGGSVSTLTLPSGREALEPLEERSLRALSPFAAFPSLERLLLTLDDSRSPDVCYPGNAGALRDCLNSLRHTLFTLTLTWRSE